jgi:hypothetical protein
MHVFCTCGHFVSIIFLLWIYYIYLVSINITRVKKLLYHCCGHLVGMTLLMIVMVVMIVMIDAAIADADDVVVMMIVIMMMILMMVNK